MIFQGSRYTGSSVIFDIEDDVPYLEFSPTILEVSEDDLVYQFREGDRLDILAHKFYDNTQLKWAILYANPQYITEFDMKNGDYITIPDKEVVMRYVNNT